MLRFSSKFLLTILFFILLSGAVNSTEQYRFVMCRNNKIVRTIRVEWSDTEQKCTTKYTKLGLDKLVGSGKLYASCVRFLDNIQTNLEKASWSCKDLSNSIVKKQ